DLSVIKVGRCVEYCGSDRAIFVQFLYRCIRAAWREAAQVVTIEDIHPPLLTSAYHQVGMSGRSDAVRQNKWATRTGVQIGVVEKLMVEWHEVVDHSQAPTIDVLFIRSSGRVETD